MTTSTFTPQNDALNVATKEILTFVYEYERKRYPELTISNFAKHIGITESGYSNLFARIDKGIVTDRTNTALKNFIEKKENSELKQSVQAKLKDQWNIFSAKEYAYHELHYTDSDLTSAELKADQIIRPIIELLIQDKNCKPSVIEKDLQKNGGTGQSRIKDYLERLIRPDLHFLYRFPIRNQIPLLKILSNLKWNEKPENDVRFSHYKNLEVLIYPHKFQETKQNQIPQTQTKESTLDPQNKKNTTTQGSSSMYCVSKNKYTNEDLTDEERIADRIVRPIIELLLTDLDYRPAQLEDLLVKNGSPGKPKISSFLNRTINVTTGYTITLAKSHYASLLTTIENLNWDTSGQNDERFFHYNQLKNLISPSLKKRQPDEIKTSTPFKKQNAGDIKTISLIQKFSSFKSVIDTKQPVSKSDPFFSLSRK